MSLLTLLLGCQAPFEEDRHDLASFRIVAVSARALGRAGDNATPLALRALIWSGKGAWHEQEPGVVWTVTGADGRVQALTGVRPETEVALPASVELLAASVEGEWERATLVVLDGKQPSTKGWSRNESDLDATDATASIAEREGAALLESSTTGPSGALRLEKVADRNLVTHWIGSGGTWAELSEHRSDWFAAELEIDDGEIEKNVPLAPGVYPALGLTFDGQGRNQWTWVDTAVDPGPHLQVDGRILPWDADFEGEGTYEATVELVDDLVGFRLSDVLRVVDRSGAEAACAEAEVGGLELDLDAVATGLCARSDLERRRVVLSGWGQP